MPIAYPPFPSRSLALTSASAAAVYSQATLTNVAIPAVTAATSVPIPYFPTFSESGITALTWGDITHWWDGMLVLPPDSLIAACTTIAATQAMQITVVWAEWDA